MYYRVWGLGDSHLEPLLTTTDTSVVLYKNQYPQQFFAVSLAGNGAAMPTGSTPEIDFSVTDCYFKVLLANYDPDINQIDLSLQLSSLYDVENITMERWEQNTWVEWAVRPPAGTQTCGETGTGQASGSGT